MNNKLPTLSNIIKYYFKHLPKKIQFILTNLYKKMLQKKFTKNYQKKIIFFSQIYIKQKLLKKLQKNTKNDN